MNFSHNNPLNFYFTSGQMCKIFSLTKQTLLFYDKIDLLKPEYTNPETKYRYYSIAQFSDLAIILSLKTSGIKLKQIKEHLEKHSIPETIDMLSLQIDQLEKEINVLKKSKTTLLTNLNTLKLSRSLPTQSKFTIETIKNNYLLLFPIPKHDKPPNFQTLFSKLVNIPEYDYAHMNWNYGWMTALRPDNQFVSRFLFIKCDPNLNHPSFFNPPKGKYLTTYHLGDYATISTTRRLLINYAREQNLALSGFIYETQLTNHFVTNDTTEYTTKLSIAIS